MGLKNTSVFTELGTGDVNWGGNTNGSAKSIGSIDNFAVSLKTNNTDRLTISESGYIGLRKTPTAPIDIAGSVVLDTNLSINVGENTTNYLGFSGANDGIFQQYSGEVIKNQIWAAGNSYINGGNLGVGTTTPTDSLSVAGALRLTTDVAFDLAKSGRIYKSFANGLILHTVKGGTNDFAIATPGGNAILINPTTSNDILIPLGSLGIGTIAPTKKLSLSGLTAQTLGMERHTTSDTAGNSLTINAGGATSGSTDKNGGTFILSPGLSTGTGFASLRLQGLTRAASTGTTDNTLVDRVIIPSRKYLTDETVVGLFEVALGSNQTTGGTINYTIHATNGTEYQSHSGIMNWSAVSKGAVITSAFGHASVASGLEIDADSTGTLVDTPSIVNGTGKITISMSVNSSLTTPVIWIEYIIFNQGSTAITQL